MSRYTVVLKPASRNGIVWMGLFLHLLSLPFFLKEMFQTEQLPKLCMGAILVALVIAVLKLKFKTSKHLVFILNYLLMAATWFAMPYFQFFGILFLILAWFDHQQLKAPTIQIGDEIRFTQNLTKKSIQWNELENLILKQGVLTIDFKNNKLLQLDIDPSFNQISEKEFNEFCESKLSNLH